MREVRGQRSAVQTGLQALPEAASPCGANGRQQDLWLRLPASPEATEEFLSLLDGNKNGVPASGAFSGNVSANLAL
ncbi:hypothetical protein EYF80_064196 [Liparis tanakae]|uniref:Uncharacterized protein n=1 Tax=Liparis tanakae TaxID=230148 RepID=A0A4Z2EAD7_9TELE|nr:hypothetical protein EYF80_064196 [Liparis tanakae]